MNQQHREELLTERQAQSVVPMSLAWFRRKRLERTGPRSVKISNLVFYRLSDLLAWLDTQLTGGGAVTNPTQGAGP